MTADASFSPHPDENSTPDLPKKSWIQRLNRREVIYAILAVLVIAAVGWFYGQVIDRENLGFTHDDGVYAVTGKALAEGKGFTLLHVVGHPAEIKYPFVYPAILALVWLVNPHFPENIPALNYITIAFTLAACGVLYLYLRQAQKFPGWLTLIIITLTTAHFFFIYFFSSVMSEGPYLFFSLLTLWTAYKATKNGPAMSDNMLWLLVILSSVTFLTRIPGITLMGAIGVWLLINGQWKNAIRYGLGCLALGVMPWLLWVKFQTPTVTEMNYPLVNAYSNYGLEFFHNFIGTNYLSSLPADLRGLFSWLLEQLFPLIPNFIKRYPEFKKEETIVAVAAICTMLGQFLLGGYYILQMVQAATHSWIKGQSWLKGRLNPAAFSIPGLYLFFYVLMITLWNYEDQLARFLTAVSPLLWLYYFKPWVAFVPEFGQQWPTNRIKGALALTGVILTATLSFWIAPSSYHTVHLSRNEHWVESGKYRWMWSEYKETFAWINQSVPKDAPLAAGSDVVFYLYTNRPTFYTFFASLRRKNGVFTEDSIPLLMKSLDFYHVQYLVAEPHMTARVIRRPVNIVAAQLLDAFPERFKKVYSSPRGAIMVYKILPEPPSSAKPANQKALDRLIAPSSHAKSLPASAEKLVSPISP